MPVSAASMGAWNVVAGGKFKTNDGSAVTALSFAFGHVRQSGCHLQLSCSGAKVALCHDMGIYGYGPQSTC